VAASGMPAPLSPISTRPGRRPGGADGQAAAAVHALHGVDDIVHQVDPDLASPRVAVRAQWMPVSVTQGSVGHWLEPSCSAS
jgi:hypothetical protein